MTFSEMMTATENGKLATRPEWNAAIYMNKGGFLVYCEKENPSFYEDLGTYEFEREDFYATDWVIL